MKTNKNKNNISSCSNSSLSWNELKLRKWTLIDVDISLIKRTLSVYKDNLEVKQIIRLELLNNLEYWNNINVFLFYKIIKKLEKSSPEMDYKDIISYRIDSVFLQIQSWDIWFSYLNKLLVNFHWKRKLKVLKDILNIFYWFSHKSEEYIKYTFNTLIEIVSHDPTKWDDIVRINNYAPNRWYFFIKDWLKAILEFTNYDEKKWNDIMEISKYTRYATHYLVSDWFKSKSMFFSSYPEKRNDIMQIAKWTWTDASNFFYLWFNDYFIVRNEHLRNDILEIIKVSKENSSLLFKNWIIKIEEFIENNTDKKEEIFTYIKKIARSKSYIEIFTNACVRWFFNQWNSWEIFTYIIRNANIKKSIEFFQRYVDAYEYKMNIDIDEFNLSFDRWIIVDNEIDENKLTKFINSIDKILNKLDYNDKKKNRIISSINTLIRIEKNNIIKIEEKLNKIIWDLLLEYHNYVFNKKLITRIINFIKNNTYWEDELNMYLWILRSNIDIIKSDSFKEWFKIISKSKYNYYEWIYALKRYLLSLNNNWESNDDALNNIDYKSKLKNQEVILMPNYNTQGNVSRLNKHLNKEQIWIWLSDNLRSFDIDYSEKEKLLIENKITNLRKKIIINIITLNKKYWFNFEYKFEKIWDLINYFEINIKQFSKEIKIKSLERYKNIENSIKELKELLKENKSKSIKKIFIEKESDFFDILMMWNYVDDSCLSYYSPTKNYWSCITNLIDVNKWVFYIKEWNWNIIWRVIVAIDNKKRLLRFPLYVSWNVWIDLNYYFNLYLSDLAEEMWLKLWWKSDRVELIEAEKRYTDNEVN